MGQFSYQMPSGATITVTAPNQEAAVPLLKAEFDRLNTRKGIGAGLQDGLAQLNQGLTLGWWDEAEAGLGAIGDSFTGNGDRPFGERYRERLNTGRNSMRQFEATKPKTAAFIEGTGAVVPGLAAPGATTIPSITRMAATSAADGALNAAGKTEFSNPDDMVGSAGELALDAVEGGAIGGALGGLLGKVIKPKRSPIDPVAEAEGLRTAARRTYTNLIDDNAPVPGFAAKVQPIFDEAERAGIGKFGDPEMYQRLETIARKLRNTSQSGRDVTYKEVDDLIQMMNNASKSPNKTQAAAARRAARQLYDALPPEIADARRLADSQYRRASRSDALTGAIEEAERVTARGGIGGNTINPQRQGVSKLLKEDLRTGRLLPEERAAMEAFVIGGDTENFLRTLASMSPNRSAMPILGFLMTGAGGLSGGVPGGAAGMMTAGGAMGLGEIGKRGAEQLTAEAVENLQRLTLRGEITPETARAVTALLRRAAGFTGAQASEQDIDYRPDNLMEMIR
jgi:hypothetical protein